jgi:dTMP kinase
VKKGFFICIEGLDGCGKTTQAKLLALKLKSEYNAFYTAEPSQGEIGKFIRTRYLFGDKRSSNITEALLFAADRFDHLERTIIPAINEGRLVISDRYLYSSLAYQGADGLDLTWIEKINSHALRPDFSVFIDVDPAIVIQRLKRRKSVMEDLETQEKVRMIYLKFVERGDLVQIDGGKSKELVSKNLLNSVTKFLEKKQTIGSERV